MGSILILCVNINVTIDTMLKFDENADANVNADDKCEGTLTQQLNVSQKLKVSVNVTQRVNQLC